MCPRQESNPHLSLRTGLFYPLNYGGTNIKNLKPIKQTGHSSVYPWRHPEDSELDINKAIKQQFNLLRVVDNEKYPAFFKYKNNRYIIKIYKE